MLSFRDTPIKRKLMFVILLTSCFALLLMGITLVTYEVRTFRRTLAANMTVLAQIIGSNSTAAIAFEDETNAQEILAALAAERQVTAAAIFDAQGKLFASFPATAGPEDFPAHPGPDGHRFEQSHLVMFQPIMQQQQRLGTIYLRADLREMYSRISLYSALLLFAGLCSFVAAIILSATLQRGVSTPILQLANVAQAVSERQDYSVRAIKHGADEIGQLTDAFNQMLGRIGQTTDDLNQAKQNAEAANNAKDNFLAILSHELRTPMTPVLATVAVMEQDNLLPAHLLPELEVIRRNVQVEARLIDDLLDVTGIIRGKLDLHREVVDLRVLLEHAMQNYCAGSAARKHLQVTTEITATHTYVMADSSRMTQVLWNLLQNACKFTAPGGKIAVRLSNEPVGKDPELVVEISDTGIGIHPETMPRIFEPFEQGERSRSRMFGGLGLGLAISRAIVELHGGSISAESEGLNKGTRITVRLATVPPPGIEVSHPTQIAAAAVQSPKLLLLLVEDHADTAEQLTRLLKRAGHQVVCATSVKDALERAREQKFDILISDLGLPDGSGYDLLRTLTHDRPIPSIALSGFGMKQDVDASIAAGFCCHLTKPVDWQELKLQIEKIARANFAGTRQSPPNQIES